MATTSETNAASKTGKNYLGIPILITGAIVAVLPRFIYQTYEAMEGMTMKCYATANAEIAVGSAIFIFGALYFFSKSAIIRLVASIMSVVSVVFALLFPTVLTGLCGDAHMACHMFTLPALILCSSFITLFASIGTVLSIKALRRADSIPNSSDES